MAMCDRCEALVEKGLETPPHEDLRQMDLTVINVPAAPSGPSIYETLYICQACSTKWRRLEERDEKIGGWYEIK